MRSQILRFFPPLNSLRTEDHFFCFSKILYLISAERPFSCQVLFWLPPYFENPFIKGWGVGGRGGVWLFQNWRKWKVGKWEKISWKIFWRFLVMHHRKKSWCVYLSFVNRHVLQNNCLSKTWDDWHCNFFDSGHSYNRYINYSYK